MSLKRKLKRIWKEICIVFAIIGGSFVLFVLLSYISSCYLND